MASDYPIVSSVLRFMASGYPFGIFKLFLPGIVVTGCKYTYMKKKFCKFTMQGQIMKKKFHGY
jgi:hypothetical protein